jgi:hypothetical protein
VSCHSCAPNATDWIISSSPSSVHTAWKWPQTWKGSIYTARRSQCATSPSCYNTNRRCNMPAASTTTVTAPRTRSPYPSALRSAAQCSSRLSRLNI